MDWDKITKVGIPAVVKLKSKMIEQKIKRAYTWCPMCNNSKSKMNAVLAGNRNHIHAFCSECKFEFHE